IVLPVSVIRARARKIVDPIVSVAAARARRCVAPRSCAGWSGLLCEKLWGPGQDCSGRCDRAEKSASRINFHVIPPSGLLKEDEFAVQKQRRTRKRFSLLSELEPEFCRNLQNARIVGSGYLAKCAGVNAPGRIFELCVIKRVERF